MGGGVEVGLSFCGLGCAACLVLALLLRCPPAATLGAPYERLADGERGLGHAPVGGTVYRDGGHLVPASGRTKRLR